MQVLSVNCDGHWSVGEVKGCTLVNMKKRLLLLPYCNTSC